MNTVIKPPAHDFGAAQARSQVFLDFMVQEGELYIALHNFGTWPAAGVRVSLNQRVIDGDGRVLNEKGLFTRLEFLAPQRALSTRVDTLQNYVRRAQPMELLATVEWIDFEDVENGRTKLRSRRIKHDLRALADLKHPI
jgi:hypothetical protein